ncbi:hypothetical protein MHX53_05670 [Brevibacterium sp. ACRRH]|nr:hypothetical protein [Brevibacterium sp. ACRRH]
MAVAQTRVQTLIEPAPADLEDRNDADPEYTQEKPEAAQEQRRLQP